jgi:Leucine-rich repeat (LRR) protein
LTSLDVSNNAALEELWCQGNQLTSVDVSNNFALVRLDCGGNQLTSLDISNNSDLGEIRIDSMPSLNKVCVWTTPFPPSFVNVDTTGSPNVYFTIHCNSTEIEKTSLPNLLIYPNPANNLLTIESDRPGQHFIEITSLNGQLYYTDRMEGPTHQIDLSSFEKGLYFIIIRSRYYVRTEKIIKQ